MTMPDQLWLTRLPLRNRSRLLRSPSAQHRLVMSLFPDGLGQDPRRRAGVLFRIEQTTPTAPPVLLVQSALRPDTETTPNARTLSLLPLLDHLREGTTVNFRIAASPMRTVLPPNAQPGSGVRGVRKNLIGAQAEEWFSDRAAKAGLQVAAIRSRDHDFGRCRLNATEKEKARANGEKVDISYPGLLFDGVAEVTDHTTLTAAVAEGIGRGRPYGLGLLSLAPARE